VGQARSVEQESAGYVLVHQCQLGKSDESYTNLTAIVDTEKSNGAIGARPYMAKVRKTAPADERTYEDWLRVQRSR
jgi:hypothetical protein